MSHYVAGWLCSVQSPAIWKRSKNYVRVFCCKILPTVRFPGVRDLEKKKKSRTRLLCKHSVPVARKWGHQSGMRSQESEGAVAPMGWNPFGYRWSEGRLSGVILKIACKRLSTSDLSCWQQVNHSGVIEMLPHWRTFTTRGYTIPEIVRKREYPRRLAGACTGQADFR